MPIAMNLELSGTCIFICGLLCLHACQVSMDEKLGGGEVPVLFADFEQSKLNEPWLITTLKRQSKSDTVYLSNMGAVAIETPNVLQSPRFRIEPLRYYRLDFRGRCTAKSYWAVTFFDSLGGILLADVYASFDPASNKEHHTFYFQSKVDAHTAEFLMRPNGEDTEVDLSSVRITEVEDRAEIKKWADSIYATIPPLDPVLQSLDPEELIPKSIATLEKGGNTNCYAWEFHH